jgi:hypothetical protein
MEMGKLQKICLGYLSLTDRDFEGLGYFCTDKVFPLSPRSVVCSTYFGPVAFSCQGREGRSGVCSAGEMCFGFVV